MWSATSHGQWCGSGIVYRLCCCLLSCGLPPSQKTFPPNQAHFQSHRLVKNRYLDRRLHVKREFSTSHLCTSFALKARCPTLLLVYALGADLGLSGMWQKSVLFCHPSLAVPIGNCSLACVWCQQCAKWHFDTLFFQFCPCCPGSKTH